MSLHLVEWQCVNQVEKQGQQFQKAAITTEPAQKITTT